MSSSARALLRRLSPLAPSRSAHRRRLCLLDRLTLAAIGTLVVLVTIPFLRSQVVLANESDAGRTLRLLAEFAFEEGGGDTELAPGLARLGAVERRLQDARVLPGGLLFHHGYLFALVEGVAGEEHLVAWPAHGGASGRAAFRLSPRLRLYVHPNAEGRWSGLARPLDGAGLAQGEDAWRRARW